MAFYVNFLINCIMKFNNRKNLYNLFSNTDLNFDWIANLLGWIEEKGFSIMCFSVNSQTTNTIYSNLDNPSSITVESHTG